MAFSAAASRSAVSEAPLTWPRMKSVERFLGGARGEAELGHQPGGVDHPAVHEQVDLVQADLPDADVAGQRGERRQRALRQRQRRPGRPGGRPGRARARRPRRRCTCRDGPRPPSGAGSPARRRRARTAAGRPGPARWAPAAGRSTGSAWCPRVALISGANRSTVAATSGRRRRNPRTYPSMSRMSRANEPRGTARGSVSSVKTAGSLNDAPYAAVDERTTSLRSRPAACAAASSCIVPMTFCSFIAARPPACGSGALVTARCTTASAPRSAMAPDAARASARISSTSASRPARAGGGSCGSRPMTRSMRGSAASRAATRAPRKRLTPVTTTTEGTVLVVASVFRCGSAQPSVFREGGLGTSPRARPSANGGEDGKRAAAGHHTRPGITCRDGDAGRGSCAAAYGASSSPYACGAS